MRSPSCITIRKRGVLSGTRATCALVLLLLSVSIGYAQRIAVLNPLATEKSSIYSDKLSETLSSRFRVVDSSLADSAYRSIKIENAFNMTAAQARDIGAVIGCDYFVLVNAATVRRSSSAKPVYFEAFAAVYLVSAHSGELVLWKLDSREAAAAAEAESSLIESIKPLADELAARVDTDINDRRSVKTEIKFESVPDDLPDSKIFRAPIPYKRIKPEYTKAAYFYDVRATVEAEVDIDADGKIRRVAIVRWAGYGLDEAVTKTIHQMNWRPAERNGKTLPMRILLRYNFTKVEKD